jgi:short-subunit dehydrogenase
VINNTYKNKNILIVGGSYGIGEALCTQLAEAGATLAIVARSEEKINTLCDQLPGNHLAIRCDLAKKSEIDILADKIEAEWKQTHLIIFCAGTYQPMSIENFNLGEAKKIALLNFNSLLDFIDSFLPLIKQKRMSQLAIISSVAGYFGMPNSLAYGASKAAVSNLTESLHYELKKYHTKVQLINPGFVKTRLTDKNTFSMPAIISADKAAQIIIQKLPKKHFEITFPFAFAITMKMLSLLPYKIRFWLFERSNKDNK